MTVHNGADLKDIAKNVIMPGDPLRAKYIAENFLENARLVSSVRNIYAYTGTYKGHEVTVMASGMGMPSMGIYCYELYKFYDVESIIRIGSCGAYTADLNLLDIVLVDGSYTEGNFANNFNNEDIHFVKGSEELNKRIMEKGNVVLANTACTEVFDPYISDLDTFLSRLPKEYNLVAAEMEAFALFYTAKVLGKKAACLLTVVDSLVKKESLSSEMREKSLNDMITIALESII